jgi:hypothetical protein
MSQGHSVLLGKAHLLATVGGLVGFRASLTALEERVTLLVMGIELRFIGVLDDVHVTVQTIVMHLI